MMLPESPECSSFSAQMLSPLPFRGVLATAHTVKKHQYLSVSRSYIPAESGDGKSTAQGLVHLPAGLDLLRPLSAQLWSGEGRKTSGKPGG